MYVLNLICLGLVKHIFGTTKIKYHINGPDEAPVEIDFTPPYQRISLLSALEKAVGNEDKFPPANEFSTNGKKNEKKNQCLINSFFCFFNRSESIL